VFKHSLQVLLKRLLQPVTDVKRRFRQPYTLVPPAAAPLPPAAPGWRLQGAPWLLGLLLLLEYGVFRQYVQQEVAWAHPGGFDQIVYLSDSYETFEKIKERGILAGLGHGLQLPVQSGMLIHLQASLLFLLLGPSRLSALTLNFGYFALLQVVLAWTLVWFSQRWSVALLGVGLLLTATAPFAPWGGMMDFRLDFITSCLFGVVLCLVVRSGVFASRRWSLLTGGVAGLCVLFRFLTLTYLVGILAALLGFYAVRWLRSSAAERPGTARRLGNLILAGLLLAGVAGPGIWQNRAGLFQHYVEHIRCAENEIRGQEFGAPTLGDRALFYVTSVARDHAGVGFGLAAALALLGALVLAGCRLARPVPCRCSLAVDLTATGVAVALGAVVPLLALVLYPSPSPVVAGVTVPAVVWAVVFAVMLLSGALPRPTPRPVATGLAILAALLVGGGLGLTFHRLSQQSWPSQYRHHEEQLLQVYDVIAQQSQQRGLTAPRIAVDHISDCLYPHVMRPSIYERHGVLLKPLDLRGQMVPTLLAVTEQEALAGLRQSDFAILTTGTTYPESQLYPFERSVQQLRPSLTKVCETDFRPVGRFHIYGRDVVVYVRPASTAAAEPSFAPPVTAGGSTITQENGKQRRFHDDGG
jgi:hypothetical protein